MAYLELDSKYATKFVYTLKSADGGSGMQLPGCGGTPGKCIADTGLVYIKIF